MFSDDRRSYPDEPPPPPVPQRVEKKPETKNVDDILKPPGRLNRPERVRLFFFILIIDIIKNLYP